MTIAAVGQSLSKPKTSGNRAFSRSTRRNPKQKKRDGVHLGVQGSAGLKKRRPLRKRHGMEEGDWEKRIDAWIGRERERRTKERMERRKRKASHASESDDKHAKRRVVRSKKSGSSENGTDGSSGSTCSSRTDGDLIKGHGTGVGEGGKGELAFGKEWWEYCYARVGRGWVSPGAKLVLEPIGGCDLSPVETSSSEGTGPPEGKTSESDHGQQGAGEGQAEDEGGEEQNPSGPGSDGGNSGVRSTRGGGAVEGDDGAGSDGGWLLPPRKKGDSRALTVALDLDETLVRTCDDGEIEDQLQPPESAAHLRSVELSYTDPDTGEEESVVSFLRPGLAEFLERLSEFAEVVVFTAGRREYAEPLCNLIDRKGNLVDFCLFNDATTDGRVKDLTLLGRDMKTTILVDNSPASFAQRENGILCDAFYGILCDAFYGDHTDQHLLGVMLPALRRLATASDVRPILQELAEIQGGFK